jgi:nicotinamide mononucleotide transporter
MSHFIHQLLAQMWDQIGGWVGLAAYVTGIASVIYAVRNHIWTWPNNIVSVILFGWIFWISKDPSNAALQVLYYLPISIFGWYAWLRLGPMKNDDLPITVLSNRNRVQWIVGTVLVALIWGGFESRYKGLPFPYSDAATTVISISAQYLQTKKRFENWILWIVADVIYAFYLFPKQHLAGLATLYLFFLAMGIAGAVQWSKIMRTDQILVKYEHDMETS